MENENTTQGEMDDAKLSEMLSMLRLEPSKEAHFEDRFLHEFHSRVVQSGVCRPSRNSIWENVRQFIGNMSPQRLALSSASAFGALALSVGLMMWPSTNDTAIVAVASLAQETPISHIGAALASMENGASQTPNLNRCDLAIKVKVKKATKQNYCSQLIKKERITLDDSTPVLIEGGTAMPRDLPIRSSYERNMLHRIELY